MFRVCPNWQVAEPGINLDRSGLAPRLPLTGMQSCEGKGLESKEVGGGIRGEWDPRHEGKKLLV